MAIEIVDLPMKHSDFPLFFFVNVYQRDPEGTYKVEPPFTIAKLVELTTMWAPPSYKLVYKPQ